MHGRAGLAGSLPAATCLFKDFALSQLRSCELTFDERKGACRSDSDVVGERKFSRLRPRLYLSRYESWVEDGCGQADTGRGNLRKTTVQVESVALDGTGFGREERAGIMERQSWRVLSHAVCRETARRVGGKGSGTGKGGGGVQHLRVRFDVSWESLLGSGKLRSLEQFILPTLKICTSNNTFKSLIFFGISSW
jgi:hypothetical protein